MKKKRLLTLSGHFCVVLMVTSMLLMVDWIKTSQVKASSENAPDKILFGNPIALSGINTPGAMMSQIRAYDLWVEEVNAKGGIYVKEYGKKIPVKIISFLVLARVYEPWCDYFFELGQSIPTKRVLDVGQL